MLFRWKYKLEFSHLIAKVAILKLFFFGNCSVVRFSFFVFFYSKWISWQMCFPCWCIYCTIINIFEILRHVLIVINVWNDIALQQVKWMCLLQIPLLCFLRCHKYHFVCKIHLFFSQTQKKRQCLMYPSKMAWNQIMIIKT